MTAAAWGTLVRNMDPGYTGSDGLRPRIQLWHGSADTTIRPANQTEAIKEWTNVMGLPTSPDTTTTVTIGGQIVLAPAMEGSVVQLGHPARRLDGEQRSPRH